ncbi:MAG: helix-turn-helix domain-containing protein [Clostridia bacterium]|nr:helix-turn-helix domain-containing protein [Clostridia bacterium]
MLNYIGNRILTLRKKYNLTQDQLAKKLGISFQAVSKWETGSAYPDIEYFPVLSEIFNVSIDYIVNPNSMENKNPYNTKYEREDYYWGQIPNYRCFDIMQHLAPTRQIKLLDIGCGEGKDAVFFARNGYDVTAFDSSQEGIKKTKQLAEKANVAINAFVANMNEFRLEDNYDIIYSSGALHYIPDDLRSEIFCNYILHTNKGGIHSMSAFVKKPFISRAPDYEKHSYTYKSGELFTYYTNLEIIQCDEVIFDCMSSGVLHKHCSNILLAKKV